MIAWQPPRPLGPALESVAANVAADGTVRLADNELQGPVAGTSRRSSATGRRSPRCCCPAAARW
jgi:hypothetical protein